MKRALVVLALVMAACSSSGTSGGESSEVGSSASVAAPTDSTAPATSTIAATSTSVSAAAGAVGPAGQEVTFTSADLEMVGTLRVPADDRPVPAAVLIHGSGPNHRDAPVTGQLNMQFGFTIPVFAEIAMGLHEEGIGVLAYDKRTCGPFNGCSDNDYPLPADDITIDAFIADAQAAVDYLRSRPEIDPGRITIIGHSQGAQFVPIMLEADPGLAGGVMIAGPFRPIDEIIRAQVESTVELLGTLGLSEPEALASPGVAGVVEIADGVDAIRQGGEEPVAGTTAGFWRSWFEVHERAQAAAVAIGQPILVLHGELDWNVEVGEARAWGELLADAGADHQVVILPCITHALNCVTESDPTAMNPDDLGSGVAPDVIDALAAFLSS
jgi:dienelactone hydrolase